MSPSSMASSSEDSSVYAISWGRHCIESGSDEKKAAQMAEYKGFRQYAFAFWEDIAE